MARGWMVFMMDKTFSDWFDSEVKIRKIKGIL
jgi:hypothetical protein